MEITIELRDGAIMHIEKGGATKAELLRYAEKLLNKRQNKTQAKINGNIYKIEHKIVKQ